MTFYKDCLGGKLTLLPVKGSAMEALCPPATHHHILHASLVNDEIALFATDMSGPDGVHQGNSISLSLSCASEEEIDTCFKKLSAGAKITEQLQQQFWGARFGALIDKYGVGWMLTFDNDD
jgi:PhnB protein